MNCDCIELNEKRLVEFLKDQAGESATATCQAIALQITSDMNLRTVLNIPFRVKGTGKGFIRGKDVPIVANFCPFCGASAKPAASDTTTTTGAPA